LMDVWKPISVYLKEKLLINPLIVMETAR